MRFLAIGDIHGASSALDALLQVVQPTPQDWLIFLGDYIDRGPDTRGVLDRLIWLHEHLQVVCLRGNHELMMLRSRTDRQEMRQWLSVGGLQALASYGEKGRSTIQSVPPEHWQFLEETCVNSFETPSHIFVHANLDPDLPLEEQNELMLFWEFLEKPVLHNSGKTMICGHTNQKSGVPLAWQSTICIDTNAYNGGWLTCLDVHSRKYWQADMHGRTRIDHIQEQDAELGSD